MSMGIEDTTFIVRNSPYIKALTSDHTEPLYMPLDPKALLCPVCGGKGVKPSSFYELPPPPGVVRMSTTNCDAPVTCKGCSGTGVVIVR